MIEEKEKNPHSQTNATNNKNLWQEILNDGMAKRDLEESNVFIFGDKFVGKRALVKMINKELLQKDEFEGK